MDKRTDCISDKIESRSAVSIPSSEDSRNPWENVTMEEVSKGKVFFSSGKKKERKKNCAVSSLMFSDVYYHAWQSSSLCSFL